MAVSPSRWLSVEDVARVLRVNKETIYRNLSEIPHNRIGRGISIPCEFLGLEPPVERMAGITIRHEPWFEQLELPFDVVPQRRWRNTGRLIQRHPFGYHR